MSKTILAVGNNAAAYPLCLAESYYAAQAGVQVVLEEASFNEQDLERRVNATPQPSLVVDSAYEPKTARGLGAVEIIRGKLGSDVPILVLGTNEETRKAANALGADYACILDFVERDRNVEKIFERYLAH